MPNASSASKKPLPELTPEQLHDGEQRNQQFIRLCIEHVRQHSGEQAAQQLIAELKILSQNS